MPPSKYTLNHPLILRTTPFDSWLELCEHVMDIAIKEVEKLPQEQLVEAATRISDEIISTAEEQNG